ncbi:hypothetical protein D1007_47079 [Hordeum vulgare]|nr:hypothetical protein D1007_47079 [Hordeum vulgare]
MEGQLVRWSGYPVGVSCNWLAFAPGGPNTSSSARLRPAPPVLPVDSTPPVPVRTMAPPVAAAWEGDHSACPAEVFTVVHPTPAIVQEEALFESNAMVAWLEREMRASRDEIAAALVKGIG